MRQPDVARAMDSGISAKGVLACPFPVVLPPRALAYSPCFRPIPWNRPRKQACVMCAAADPVSPGSVRVEASGISMHPVTRCAIPNSCWIRSLVIPPAWTKVAICPSPNGHLQAVGIDARGRKQYRYHPRYRAIRDQAKFSRMIAFGAVLAIIRRRVEEDLKRPGLSKQKVLATVVRLLETSFIRVGNDEYARENDSVRSFHSTVYVVGRIRMHHRLGVAHVSGSSAELKVRKVVKAWSRHHIPPAFAHITNLPCMPARRLCALQTPRAKGGPGPKPRDESNSPTAIRSGCGRNRQANVLSAMGTEPRGWRRDSTGTLAYPHGARTR